MSASPQLLAVQVRGSSMNQIAAEGDYAVYDRDDRQLVDGKFYLFLVDGEVTFKQYRDTKGPPRLEPHSSEDHDTLYPEHSLHVIGRVVEIVKRLP